MRIWRRKKFENEMAAELEFHVDAYVEDLVRSGVERQEEATRRARLEFGAIEATKDECRQARGLQWLDELRADLRYTFRNWRRNPGFAAVAVLSLALGIGANSAIFGLAEAVMLRTLPVRDAGRLVFVGVAGTAGRDGPPYPFFELLRDQVKSFESIAAFSASNMELTIDAGREQVRGVWTSGNFYRTLGVAPVLGRTLTPADDQTPGQGGPDGPVAVISRTYWQQRFGGDPAVVGRAVRMRFDVERRVTVVGVMPADIMTMEPGRPIDIAVPMILSDPAKMRDRTSLWLDAVARLRPGVPLERARAEANAVFRGYMADVHMPREVQTRLFDHAELASAGLGLSGLRRQFSQPITAMMILAGLVLLAACVNVANLMLARATARQREFSVRLAIGAGRGRLVRQSMTEALALVGSDALFGILLARQGETALARFFAEGRYPVVLDLSMSGRVLSFTLAMAVLSGLAFGTMPALRASGVDAGAGLQGGWRGVVGGRSSMRLGRALVITQVALSTVLLAGAGLFIRSLRQLESVNIGIVREGILTMEVTPEREMFGTPLWLTEQQQILERVRAIPGVLSATWATMTPLSGRGRGAVLDVAGFTPRSEQDKDVHLAALSPEYFETFGVRILLGRGFTSRDSATSAKVAVFNESAARFFFGNGNPIGRRVRFANYPNRDLVYEIAGVVKDVKHNSLREEAPRFIYLPIAQSVDRINRLTLAVRCSGDAPEYAAAVRREVQGVRAAFLINNVATVETQVRESLRSERLVTGLSMAFGILALVLAGIGLYGILSYAVTRRTSEIGIRMAVGATPGQMVRMILREALVLVGGGILMGIPAVVLVGRVSRALLYGVGEFDLVGFGAAMVVLLVCAGIAGMVPALRAGRLDPISALRCE